MVYWVLDIFELEDLKGSTLSFVVTGDPPVQERARMNWKNCDDPMIYDPSSAAKKRYGLAVKQAMADIGIANLPYLSGIKPVTLEIKFFLPRCKQDCRIQGVALGGGGPCALSARMLTIFSSLSWMHLQRLSTRTTIVFCHPWHPRSFLQLGVLLTDRGG
jgi:hypothetical protein